MEKKLPLYEMMIGDTIEGEEEVDFIALVEYPAIQKNFLAFSQQFVEPSQGESKEDFLPRCIEYMINEGKESEQAVAICSSQWEGRFQEDSYNDYPQSAKDNAERGIRLNEAVGFNKFNIENQEQRIVTGALMIADLPIYRRDEDEEYYVSFSAAEIKKIVQRFFKKGYQSKVNVEHSTPVDGVYMFESFIIDREKGIMPPKGFEDISNGSWFGSFKVDNEKIWNEVKAGTFKGFSVEGLFRYEKTNKVVSKEEEIMAQIFKILSQIEQ
jgi:hypothetical protein